MAINTEWRYGVEGVANIPQHGNFANVIQLGERLWMSASATQKENLEVGQWSPATIITNDDGSIYKGTANNCRYISPTEVDINETGTVNLDTSQVDATKCTVKVVWEDDALATQLSNIKFYAFDGVDPVLPPENMTVVAFARGDTTIERNQVGGDVQGMAWNRDGGVNGLNNALYIPDRALAPSHSFYIGFSARVDAYGLHNNSQLRLSFDVS